ncbi:MAG TPA: hydantoinase/oxoprolinase family protein [Casimicrobiaceae bacterium]|nr:hydantoinase/oxoprolinase family protein [Casimicrobiaceae bacterium]
MAASRYRIGVDIGGTFTDFALFDDQARDILTHKALTTPADPAQAVIDGVAELVAMAGIATSDIGMVVHGTTLVTNAVIERKGTPTAMIVTRGFRDVLDIAMECRYDLFDLRIRFPAPVVPRHLRFEVDERVKWDGSVATRLSLANLELQMRDAVARFGVRGVAVCLLHSYANPEHELALAHWLGNRFPELKVSASSVVFPFMREYQRWTTACINAYVQPVVDAYLDRLARGLGALGFTGRFLVMSSSGSTLTADLARRFPVRLLESGPAAGALMAARHARELDLPQILSFDMGGTTAKGCMIRDNVPLKRYELEVARIHEFKRGSGLPVKIPVIDMIEIGAGGGSLAHLDDRGVIGVGPQSAGADPGPACYGRGGREPTLTDANLLLGYLDSSSFLGGRMRLDREAALRAVEHRVGGALGVSAEQAAWGIHEVINEDVAKAFRVHASERGVDYRRCSMVVFGGSGPIHGSRIARKLRIPRVVCPAGAGVMSAFGLLASPIGFEQVQSLRVDLAALTERRFRDIVASLLDGVKAHVRESGVQEADCRVRLKVDMRYIGQGYEVEVPLPSVDAGEALAAMPEAFAREYAAVFGTSFSQWPVEVIAWKVDVTGPLPGEGSTYRLRDTASAGEALRGRRQAFFPESGGAIECPVYARPAMRAGDRVAGPALIEEAESTCVLVPGDHAHIDTARNLVIDVEES